MPDPATRSTRIADFAARLVTVLLQPNVLQAVLLSVLAGPVAGYPLVATVFLVAFVLPLASYVLYVRSLGLPLGFDLDRRYRLFPFLLNSVFLALLAGAVYGFFLRPGAVQPGVGVLFGVAYLLLVNTLAGIATAFFKLSLHLTAAAGMSLLLYLPGSWGLWLRLGVLFGGIVLLAWARLHLRAHTALEVVAGIALGFSVPLAILMSGLRLPLQG